MMKLIKKVILASVLVGACNMVQASLLTECNQTYLLRDYQNTIKLCLEPATRGDEGAQVNLMLSYIRLKNYPQGLKWAKKLAAQRNVYGLHMLGGYYLTGEGVKEDHEKAKKLWIQACNAGHSPACDSLQEDFN